MKSKNMNGVYIAELDRFGYTLRVVGENKEQAEQAMREVYIHSYAKWNDLDEHTMRSALERPIPDDDDEDDDVAYTQFVYDYKRAFDECEARFYEFGKVEWE